MVFIDRFIAIARARRRQEQVDLIIDSAKRNEEIDGNFLEEQQSVLKKNLQEIIDNENNKTRYVNQPFYRTSFFAVMIFLKHSKSGS